MKARLFRQFFTDPIARDPRVPIAWRVGKTGSGVKYHARLTGNDNVRLNWNIATGILGERTCVRQEPRAPTAVCMNILFTLLTLAQHENPVEFTSLQNLCKLSVGVTRYRNPRYGKYALDALRLWQQLGVSWVGLGLGPPIVSIEVTKGTYSRYLVTMSEAWLGLCRRSRIAKVSLPLPMVGTAQNIVLKTLYDGNQVNVPINAFFYKVSGNKRCAPRGLTHWGTARFSHIPLESWVIVRRWYDKQGGKIDWVRHPYSKAASQNRLIPSVLMHIQVSRP